MYSYNSKAAYSPYGKYGEKIKDLTNVNIIVTDDVSATEGFKVNPSRAGRVFLCSMAYPGHVLRFLEKKYDSVQFFL
jgi:hypothetical protein